MSAPMYEKQRSRERKEEEFERSRGKLRRVEEEKRLSPFEKVTELGF